jgi:hypothetical protein
VPERWEKDLAHWLLVLLLSLLVLCAGIGPTAAALCVYDVMSQCGPHIKDVFYSGTAGWSAQVHAINQMC